MLCYLTESTYIATTGKSLFRTESDLPRDICRKSSAKLLIQYISFEKNKRTGLLCSKYVSNKARLFGTLEY